MLIAPNGMNDCAKKKTKLNKYYYFLIIGAILTIMLYFLSSNRFPSACDHECTLCDFNQCWKGCACRECLICIERVTGYVNFYSNS